MAGVHGVSPCSRYFLASPKSQYIRGRVAFADRSHAVLLTDAKAKPGGAIQPFWEPLRSTSISHSSVFTSIEPTELMPSTIRSLSRDFTTLASAWRSLVTPVDVSLWVR